MAPYALASKKHVAPYAPRSKVTAGPVVNLPVPYSHEYCMVPYLYIPKRGGIGISFSGGQETLPHDVTGPELRVIILNGQLHKTYPLPPEAF